MGKAISSRTRLQIKEDIGVQSGILVMGSASATSDTASLIDTYGLARAGTNGWIGRQAVIVTPAGSIVAGEKRFISASIAGDVTISPVWSAASTILDAYHIWELFREEDIDIIINQAIREVERLCFQNKQAIDILTLTDTLEYALDTAFINLHRVEYVKSIGVDHLLDDCEAAWTAGSSVTATADSTFTKVGTYSAKFVVAAGAASGATLCYKDITSVDLSDSDKVEIWWYNSIATTAGQLQFMLGATAAIGSPLETINIPAMSASTWYRHSISLANRHLDTAIISIGVRQASGVDLGAFTFYLDDVRSVLDGSKDYEELNHEYWDIVPSSTAPKLYLESEALSIIGTEKQLRLSGGRLAATLSSDSATSEIDPAWLVERCILKILQNHQKSPQLTLAQREDWRTRWSQSERDKMRIASRIENYTKWVS